MSMLLKKITLIYCFYPILLLITIFSLLSPPPRGGGLYSSGPFQDGEAYIGRTYLFIVEINNFLQAQNNMCLTTIYMNNFHTQFSTKLQFNVNLSSPSHTR